MPDSIQGLTVFALALLPGALYIWSFEMIVGRWGVGLADRVFRFIGVSAIFQLVDAPFAYALWLRYMRTGRLQRGDVPWMIWFVPVAYVLIPIAVGRIVAVASRKGQSWSVFLTGPNPAPRAWDHLFGGQPEGWVRIKMKSGVWLGGEFAWTDAGRSYAAGYPEEQDLYLVEAAEVDPETGAFMFDGDGNVALRGSNLLVRWGEMEYLEFEAEPRG